MRIAVSRSNTLLRVFMAMIILSVTIPGMHADDRDENIDVFVVLDKSLSMVEEIASVRDYVQSKIVDDILIPGDQLVLITFFGEAETLYAGDVTGDKSDVRSSVESITADGRFTDIGNALDALKNAIPQREIEGRRKYLLLITDGIQEAPPGSPYYSAELAFNHEFLQNAKEIQMAGWKVHILGLGTTTTARELAEKLSGTYTEVEPVETEEEAGVTPEELTEQLVEATEELLGFLELTGPVTVKPVNARGNSSIRFSVSSTGYESVQRISIDAISLELQSGEVLQISDEAAIVEVGPESSADMVLPVHFDSDLAAGGYDGVLTFWFDGNTAFTPGATRVHFRVKSFLANYFWLIPLGVIVLGAIAAGIMLSLRGGGKSVEFVCEIDDGGVRKRGYKLKFGEELFIIDGVMGFNILPQAGQTPAARLTADTEGLHLSVTDAKQFTVPSIPGNLIGNKLVVRKKSGRKATLSFDAN